MPPVNHVALSAGIIAVSVVVAAGIAIYESPELRRIAENLRQRIAIALHSLGDSISPQERENLFNRPEDAEGFLLSRGINIREEEGVDADDETRRRQREELMYWNAIAESKREMEHSDLEKAGDSASQRPRAATRGSSFDDFLREDSNAEKGTYIFNTGTDRDADTEGLRRRGAEGLRGLNHSVYTNPFVDEHGVDDHVTLENSLMEPDKDELDDIYSVSNRGRGKVELDATATLPAPLVELHACEDSDHRSTREHSSTLEQELGPDEYMTAGQLDRQDAYSSIQAWAQNSDPSFYSPLPVSPAGPLSEPGMVSEGALTPTESASLAGSGEDIGDEACSEGSHRKGRFYDVISDDEGMATPASWTEVGSVVSESEAGDHVILA